MLPRARAHLDQFLLRPAQRLQRPDDQQGDDRHQPGTQAQEGQHQAVLQTAYLDVGRHPRHRQLHRDLLETGRAEARLQLHAPFEQP